MILITDLQYFPSIIWYKISNNYSNIVFEQYEYYQKMSFRNRCQIAGSQGIVDLSIPLEKGRDQKALMKEVKIAGTYRWQDQHWKTLLACYSRSPWFEFYRDDLDQLYRKPFQYLMDWNLACFEWTRQVLNIPSAVSLTELYRPDGDYRDWTDYRGELLPKNIGDTVLWPPLTYRQVFEEVTGFIPNLSILDLMFCEGPRAKALIGQVG
jgi:hypothetical protein